MEQVTGMFLKILRHLYNFQFTLFKPKAPRHCSVVLLIELTVPREENREEVHERKKKQLE